MERSSKTPHIEIAVPLVPREQEFLFHAVQAAVAAYRAAHVRIDPLPSTEPECANSVDVR